MMRKFTRSIATFFIMLAMLFMHLLNALWTLLKRSVKFIKNWNEFVTVPLALGLFWFIRPMLRWMDPTAGVFDVGILHVFFAGLVIFLLMIGAAWLIVRLTYKMLYVYLDVQIEIDFHTLTTFQKCILSIGFFSVVLIAFAITLAAL